LLKKFCEFKKKEGINMADQEMSKTEKITMEVVAGGSLAEGVAGAGAVAVSIIGLAGVVPGYMAGVAAILVGAAFLLFGTSVAARYTQLLKEETKGQAGTYEIASGMSAEFFAGIAGVILGILALLGVIPGILAGVAAIIFGGASILGMGTTARLNDLEIEKKWDKETSRHIARTAVKAAEGMQILIGLGIIVLGIIAVIGIFPEMIALVALLSAGFSNLLTGTALSGRVLSTFRV
jgi:hypothetical protein